MSLLRFGLDSSSHAIVTIALACRKENEPATSCYNGAKAQYSPHVARTGHGHTHGQMEYHMTHEQKPSENTYHRGSHTKQAREEC